MSKKSLKLSFSKANLSKNDKGEYMVEEVSKDETKTYNLSKALDEFIGLEGLSISIGQDSVLPSEE
jgi:hypothetical protein